MESRDNKIQALDTNIILRLILNDNPEQRNKIVNLLTKGGEFYVDDYVFGECEHVLSRVGFSRIEIIERLKILLLNEIFVWRSDLFEKVFEDYLTHPKLSFNDCYLAEKVKGLGYEPLWTFDQKIVAQLGAKIPV